MDRRKYFFELKRQKQSATEIIIPLSFSGTTNIAPEFRTNGNTSNLFIDFGNGNSYTFNNESTYVASQTYAAGTYNIRITGALNLVSHLYLNSCGLIGTLELNNLILTVLEIKQNPNLDNLLTIGGGYGLIFDNNLQTLTVRNPVADTNFQVTSVNNELSAVNFSTDNFFRTNFEFNNLVNLTIFNLSAVKSFDTKAILNNCTINTITMPSNASCAAYFYFVELQLTSIVNFSGITSFTGTPSINLNSSFVSASLLESQVLNILNWANAINLNNVTLNISGTNPIANAQTITYINSLISKGWTVTYN